MAYKKEKGGPKMYGKHDGPKMGKTPTYMKSSGFKMKSGSPFQRNFGIGASPVKAAKPDYPDIDGDGNTTESMKQAAADKKSPVEMASPMKNYKNPQDYKVFNMGNKPTPMEMHKPNHGDFSQMSPSWAGDEEAMKELSRKRSRVNELGELPSMTDEQNEEYQSLKAEVLEMDRQYNESQKGLPMQSPMKNSGEEFARQIKEQDYQGNMPAESFKRVKDQHDKGHAKGNPHA